MTLAWLAAAWIAGIAAAATYGREAWPLALAMVALGLACSLIRRDWRTVLLTAGLAGAFALALVRFEAAQSSLAPDDVSHLNDGVAMRVRGIVRDDAEARETTQRFAVSVRDVQRRGAWEPASGGVLVYAPLIPKHRAGDVLVLEGKLESPPELDGFDYAEYLSRQGIGSVMSFPKIRIVGHDEPGPARAVVLRVRRELAHALTLALPEPQASLAQGVLLGRKSALPPDLRDDLNASNTSHLVVVSGSNVVLVSAYTTLALAWLVGRRRALVASIAAIAAYAVLVGGSPPVLRATIMGVLLVAASLSGRRSNGLVAITLAAALMTGMDPGVVRDVSFQLSFAATAGILYLATPLRRWALELIARVLRLEELPRWTNVVVAEPLAMTIAAVVATSPLLALQFGRLSLVALPANLLVVPAFMLILGSSLLAALGGLLPVGRLVFAAPAYYLLTYWIVVARWFASLPHATGAVGGYSTPWLLVTYAVLGACAVTLVRFAGRSLPTRLAESRPFQLRRAMPLALIGLPAVALAVSASCVLMPSQRRLQVTFLDVGQGDAVLIETPGGEDVLVDGGPGGAVLRGLGEELPWHDRSLDLMVLTHPQADHVTGLVDVLDRYDVRRALVPASQQHTIAYDAWLAAIEREGARVERARRGMSFDLGDGIRLDVLSPDAVTAQDASVNDAGTVLLLSWRDVRFLITADIEARAERALLASGADLHATVLKAAHHGSATSSIEQFVEAVQPQVAVISAGEDNAYGHPAPEVVERLREYGQVYTTAASGSVRFETDGQRLWVSTAR